MPTMVPASKPGMEESKARALLMKAGGVAQVAKVALIGVRGYYLRTMGEADRNDRGIYDDAIVLVSPSGIMTFNANTDPSIFRKGIATLAPGVHLYRKGKHPISRPGGYPALRPATPGERLPVIRDPGIHSFGVAINIHRGSLRSTSSEGCQTVYPLQWQGFIGSVYAEMDRHGQTTIPYLLLENDGSIA